MKIQRLAFLIAMLFLIISFACTPQISASNGRLVSLNPQQPTQAIDGGLQSLTIAHPPMAVGSIQRYFDGALLDAVPNNGPFLMGGGGPDNPQHQVTVSDFWIYSTEVSNQMYAACVTSGKCNPPDPKDDPNFGSPLSVNDPVVGVNWQQASDYCAFAHGRLPTEAEWEKAASWDPLLNQQRLYPWGDQAPACDLLNSKFCVNKVTSVAQYGQGRSFYGAYNMAGNVFEWVDDWFQSTYYANAPTNDPVGPDTGTVRVIRSSAYDSDAAYAESNRRFSAQPSSHRANLGFRCVVKDPAYFAPFCETPVFYGVDPSATAPSSKPCPDPTIMHSESCTSDHTPLETVTVRNNGPTTLTVTGLEACDPANNEIGIPHQCGPGVTIEVSAACDALPGGVVTCPPDFRQDPNNPKQCISPGGPGACPAGFQYDNQLQCCSAIPSDGGSLPLCGVGQHLFGGVCVNDFGGPQQPNSVTFTTFSISCVAPTQASNGANIVPVPTVPSLHPTPRPGPRPGPGHGPGQCKPKPKFCLFGVDPATCKCRKFP